jgi:hypothetical protein
VVEVTDDIVRSKIKVGLLEDEMQAGPFFPGLKVKGSTEAEPWSSCTCRGHRELLVVADTEKCRESVLKRSLSSPKVKPKHSSVPIPYHVFGSQFNEVLDFVQTFPERRAPHSRTREDTRRRRILGSNKLCPQGVVSLEHFPNPFEQKSYVHLSRVE